MSIEAMNQALGALRTHAAPHPMVFRAMDALRLAIEQAEKPWVKTYTGGTPHYTTPDEQPRQWQGLTDEEIMEPWPFENRVAFARWLETKLKEKNT